MGEEGDKWNLLASSYWDKFQIAFDQMSLAYDEDESGYIDSEEEDQANISEFKIGRA